VAGWRAGEKAAPEGIGSGSRPAGEAQLLGKPGSGDDQDSGVAEEKEVIGLKKGKLFAVQSCPYDDGAPAGCCVNLQPGSAERPGTGRFSTFRDDLRHQTSKTAKTRSMDARQRLD
jgi:hypothetical protein